jgi:hypothetical protein
MTTLDQNPLPALLPHHKPIRCPLRQLLRPLQRADIRQEILPGHLHRPHRLSGPRGFRARHRPRQRAIERQLGPGIGVVDRAGRRARHGRGGRGLGGEEGGGVGEELEEVGGEAGEDGLGGGGAGFGEGEDEGAVGGPPGCGWAGGGGCDLCAGLVGCGWFCHVIWVGGEGST